MGKREVFILIALVVVGGLLPVLFFISNKNNQLNLAPVTNDYSDLIKIENLKNNQAIKSSFVLNGQARGSWYFEASFPVKVVDLQENIICETFAIAKDNWMTESFVPFEAILNFEIAKNSFPAILILKKDNPSGLSENDKEIRIPVILIK